MRRAGSGGAGGTASGSFVRSARSSERRGSGPTVQAVLNDLTSSHPEHALQKTSRLVREDAWAVQLGESKEALGVLVNFLNGKNNALMGLAADTLRTILANRKAWERINRGWLEEALGRVSSKQGKQHALKLQRVLQKQKSSRSLGTNGSRREKASAQFDITPYSLDEQEIEGRSDGERAFNFMQLAQRKSASLRQGLLAHAKQLRTDLATELREEQEHDKGLLAELGANSELVSTVKSSLQRDDSKRFSDLEKEIVRQVETAYQDFVAHTNTILRRVVPMPQQQGQLEAQMWHVLNSEKQEVLAAVQESAVAPAQHKVDEAQLLMKAQVESLRVRSQIMASSKGRMKKLKDDYGDELAFMLQQVEDQDDLDFAMEDTYEGRDEHLRTRLIAPAKASWEEFMDGFVRDVADKLDADSSAHIQLRQQCDKDKAELDASVNELVVECIAMMKEVEQRTLEQDLLRRQGEKQAVELDRLAQERKNIERLQAKGFHELESQRLRMERELLQRDRAQLEEKLRLERERLELERQQLNYSRSRSRSGSRSSSPSLSRSAGSFGPVAGGEPLEPRAPVVPEPRQGGGNGRGVHRVTSKRPSSHEPLPSPAVPALAPASPAPPPRPLAKSDPPAMFVPPAAPAAPVAPTEQQVLLCMVAKIVRRNVVAVLDLSNKRNLQDKGVVLCQNILANNLEKFPPPFTLKAPEGLGYVHYDANVQCDLFVAVLSAPSLAKGAARALLTDVLDALVANPGLAIASTLLRPSPSLMSILEAAVARHTPKVVAPSLGSVVAPGISVNACGACGEHASPAESIVTGQRTFHIRCFRCGTCHKEFTSADVIKLRQGKAFHKLCYESQKRALGRRNSSESLASYASFNTLSTASVVSRVGKYLCKGCGEGITKRCVKVGKERWHELCFKCSGCSNSLLSGYMVVNQELLCAKCGKDAKKNRKLA